MMEPAIRQHCRNLKCRRRLPEPVANERAAFCDRGCFNQHFHNRCVVCEREFERKTHNKLICGRLKCRNALKRDPAFYRPLHLGPLAADPVKKAAGYERDRRTRWHEGDPAMIITEIGLEMPEPDPPTGCVEPPLKSACAAGTELCGEERRPSLSGLRGWKWVRMVHPGAGRPEPVLAADYIRDHLDDLQDGFQGDDDWELFDRQGRMAARIRQEEDSWWVARPRMFSDPPFDHTLTAAMRRAETMAMQALPSDRMPVQPRESLATTPMENGCYSESGKAWVRSALAACEAPLRPSARMWDDGLDIPEFLRRDARNRPPGRIVVPPESFVIVVPPESFVIEVPAREAA